MSLTPYIRTPYTDITGGMINHQFQGRCAKEEMRYMDCLEAYGFNRGLVKCEHLIDDYKECQTLNKQYRRFIIMRRERERQIRSGELEGKCKYVTPKIDSY